MAVELMRKKVVGTFCVLSTSAENFMSTSPYLTIMASFKHFKCKRSNLQERRERERERERERGYTEHKHTKVTSSTCSSCSGAS